MNALDKRPFAHENCSLIIFIRDSNHAICPFAGNGANMTLCDAWDLAEQLCQLCIDHSANAPCPFALARPRTCIIVVFFGLDALAFRVPRLSLHISARHPSMTASCPAPWSSLYCDALLCITTKVSCHTVINIFNPPHSFALLFRNVISSALL